MTFLSLRHNEIYLVTAHKTTWMRLRSDRNAGRLLKERPYVRINILFISADFSELGRKFVRSDRVFAEPGFVYSVPVDNVRSQCLRRPLAKRRRRRGRGSIATEMITSRLKCSIVRLTDRPPSKRTTAIFAVVAALSNSLNSYIFLICVPIVSESFPKQLGDLRLGGPHGLSAGVNVEIDHVVARPKSGEFILNLIGRLIGFGGRPS